MENERGKKGGEKGGGFFGFFFNSPNKTTKQTNDHFMGQQEGKPGEVIRRPWREVLEDGGYHSFDSGQLSLVLAPLCRSDV